MWGAYAERATHAAVDHRRRLRQAAEGLAAIEQDRPDVLLTDYLMPGMTGAELVQRARVEVPGVPMIIATGYADMRAIEQVIGDDMLLRKPFQLAELAATVERALDNRGKAASAA